MSPHRRFLQRYAMLLVYGLALVLVLCAKLCAQQGPSQLPFHNPGVLSQIQNWRPEVLNHTDPCPFTGKAHLISLPGHRPPKNVLDACEGRYSLSRLKLNADYAAIWDSSQAELNAELQHAHHWYTDCLLYAPQAQCYQTYQDMLHRAWKAWYEKYTALRLCYAEDVIRLDLAFYDCLGT